jgi:hypothetical protein
MIRLFAKRTMFSLIVAALLLLAACATHEPPDSNPNPVHDSEEIDLEALAANPHHVSITLDSSRRVTHKITPEGGTLSTTAANGTVFTLRVPKNAVLSDLEVSMTPITTINGLPLTGGYIGAVHLEPEGMEFLEPVKLTIRAPQPFDTSKLTGLNSHELGKGFYLQPRTVSGQTITLSLAHFSNPGAALWSDADIEFIKSIIPNAPRDRFEHSITVSTITVRPVTARIDNYYAQVKSRLESALTDDSKLKGAIREFLTWRKTVSELGLNETYKAKIFQGWTLVAGGIEGAVEKAYAKCVVNDDFTNVVDILGWISWVKRNPCLAPYFEGKLAAFEQKASNCASFELTFEYELQQRSINRGDHDPSFITTNILSSHEIQTQFEVGYSFAEGMLIGQAPLETTLFTASGFSGAVKNLHAGDPVSASRSEPLLDFKVGGDGVEKSNIPLVSLLIDGTKVTPTKTLTLVIDRGNLTELFLLRGQEFGSIDRHGGAYRHFPYLNDIAASALWRVPLVFNGSMAEYTKLHTYQGPHYLLPWDTRFTLELTGSTTLTLRHTPK